MTDQTYHLKVWLDSDTHVWSLEPPDSLDRRHLKPLSASVTPYEASLIFTSVTLEGLPEPCPISDSGVPRMCRYCLAALCAASWAFISNALDETLKEPRQ